MHVEHLTEPELEFGSGRHIDSRFGIMNLGPLGVALPSAPHVIKVGICGATVAIGN